MGGSHADKLLSQSEANADRLCLVIVLRGECRKLWLGLDLQQENSVRKHGLRDSKRLTV